MAKLYNIFQQWGIILFIYVHFCHHLNAHLMQIKCFNTSSSLYLLLAASLLLFHCHSLSNTLWCNHFSVWHQWIRLIINAWPATHRHGCRLISATELQQQFRVKIWQHISCSWWKQCVSLIGRWFHMHFTWHVIGPATKPL